MSKPFANPDIALGLCDRCGFQYLLKQLIWVTMAELGTPSNQRANLKVCHSCKDEVNPQVWVPMVIQRKGADAQALKDPRPEVLPPTFPVVFSPNVISRGNTTPVRATSVFGGYSVSVTTDTDITASGAQLLTGTKALMLLTVTAGAQPGTHIITVHDGQGANLAGVITVI